MKAAFIIIIFFTISLGLHAQGLITHEETQKFQFDFRYEEMSPPESLPNNIIHKMALIKAPTKDYFFGFTLYEKSRIIKLKQNNYRLLLNIDSINFYNKLNYKGYKLNNLVFPNLLKINIQIEDRNSSQEFIISSQKRFSISNTGILDTIYIDTTHTGYFIIKNLAISCLFTEAQMQKLDSVMAAINKLEELNPNLLQIKAKLWSLQNIKAGMARIYNIDLKSIEKDLKEMNPHILFSNDLSIELKKEGSLALYDSLVVLARKTRKRFDHMITMPEYEYYSEGYHALRNGKREVAKSYFLKSISQKPSYPPPYYALAEMAYHNQEWDSCARTVLYILNDLKPDFTIRKNTLILGSKLYNTIT